MNFLQGITSGGSEGGGSLTSVCYFNLISKDKKLFDIIMDKVIVILVTRFESFLSLESELKENAVYKTLEPRLKSLLESQVSNI